MPDRPTVEERLDVIVIGAGMSGIAAGHQLVTEHPASTFVILEARDAIGGTWDLFRYPGIRSDSDLHTFGYDFKPWRSPDTIAEASQILTYLGETVDDDHLAAHIRLRHRVIGANWDSDQARWLVEVERPDSADQRQTTRIVLAARWLFCGAGYYRYDEGYTPAFPGRDRFAGPIVHPQHWPHDLDLADQHVVVIGSGATAVTLVPALADLAGHVTMLQRTPTYVISIPRRDALAHTLRRVLGDDRGHRWARRKNLTTQRIFIEACRRSPNAARRWIRHMTIKSLPPGYPVDEHFNPPYRPWDQRLCMAPDGDLFRVISDGRADIVTDRISTFTEAGLLLESGTHLDADVIVTATGLHVQLLGGIALAVDGRPVDLADQVAYRGAMLTGVPNFVVALGYTTQPWTLKLGPLLAYTTALIRELDARNADAVWPLAPAGMPTRPLLSFGAGYIQRALDRMPRQGLTDPWIAPSTSWEDRQLRKPAIDGHLQFASRAGALRDALLR
ncbi:MAG: NAD(P)/FAD-dependent oxidoreductase [Phycicoccus sp.]|nr:NAD(P)/FAD-dependent oxidoreductase [Phycicoccus sp.]